MAYPDAVAVGHGDDLPFQGGMVLEHRPRDVGHRPEDARTLQQGEPREKVDEKAYVPARLNPEPSNHSILEKDNTTETRGGGAGEKDFTGGLEMECSHGVNSSGIQIGTPIW